jgi:hypothetical protein
MELRIAALAGFLACASCVARESRVTVVDRSLLPGPPAQLTVLVFFSPHCHCLTLHEQRLAALYDRYAPRGVQFLMIDSEVSGSEARDRDEAQRRGYRFPIVRDPGAKLAGMLGAEYATYSVVLDAEGRVRYHGGIDDDKTHLTERPTPYLQDAIEDVLSGREPRVTEGKTMGCALETW